MNSIEHQKLVQITATLDATLGGPPKVVRETFPYLREFSDAHLIVFGNSDFTEENLLLNKTLFNNRFGFRFNLPNTKSIRLIRDADIILIHGFYLYSTLLALFFATRADLHIMPHGSLENYQEARSQIRKRIFRKIFHWVLRGRKLSFLVASEMEKISVNKIYPEVQIIVVGLGVNFQDFNHTSTNIPQPPFKLLSLSRVVSNKRIDLSIEALDILRKLGLEFNLNIYGEGNASYLDLLRNLAFDLNLENEVRFHNFVDSKLKREILSSSHILLLPSENENFSIAVAESIVSNVPVIVYKKVAMGEFVKKYQTGVVISNLDAAEIAKAVIHIMSNYDTFQDNCRKNAYRLSWNQVILVWIRALKLDLK